MILNFFDHTTKHYRVGVSRSEEYYNALLNLGCNFLDHEINSFSPEFLENAIMIECEVDSLDYKLTGYVGLPTYSRSQSDWQYFYVNGRIVKDPCIAHAIKQAYKDVLYHGRHPVFVLYFWELWEVDCWYSEGFGALYKNEKYLGANALSCC